jgi:hypothetical protein
MIMIGDDSDGEGRGMGECRSTFDTPRTYAVHERIPVVAGKPATTK